MSPKSSTFLKQPLDATKLNHMQSHFNESNQRNSHSTYNPTYPNPEYRIAHLAEHPYVYSGSDRASSKKVCTLFSSPGWHLPETMNERSKRGPEGKLACRRHDIFQHFCQLWQRKRQRIPLWDPSSTAMTIMTKWHSISRIGLVCHTRL